MTEPDTEKVSIGVFDSGLGGLSVVRALFESSPSATITYFADTAHVPYGDRPPEEVRAFALGIVDFLLAQGARAILMACNMSSAIALADARRLHPAIPVVGVIEAGARAAVQVAQGPVGVLATSGTVNSEAYPRAIARLKPGIPVFQTACPEFVPLIEAGEIEGPRAAEAVRQCLAPGLAEGVRTFICGCTHYPFLLPVMRALAPEGTRFVDPAREAAAEILHGLGSRLKTEGGARYVLSAPTETFRPVGSRFLGRPLPELQIAQWEDGKLTLTEGRSPAATPEGKD